MQRSQKLAILLRKRTPVYSGENIKQYSHYIKEYEDFLNIELPHDLEIPLLGKMKRDITIFSRRDLYL